MTDVITMTDTAPETAGAVGDPAAADSGLVVGADGLARCRWADSSPEYRAYHDEEWGRPVRDDDRLFERLTLEAFQSGLSWLTILRKREAFRRAFDGFSIPAVAAYSEADAARLMADASIVRNHLKIAAALHNAKVAAALPDGLAALLWSYAPPPRPRPATFADIPATTPESVAMTKELKRRGFRFVGPTTAYALMQAAGMVDDHVAGCHVPPSAFRAPAGGLP
jgi:DNA-3-methyladenine glycosylase I